MSHRILVINVKISLLLEIFNALETEQEIGDFIEPTCFKSSNPRCIDLILKNRGGTSNIRRRLKLGCPIFTK